MTTLIDAALRRALSQDGVRENRVNGHANNTGKAVDEYLRSVGLPPGNAWCAAFVYWAIAAEAKAAGLAEVPFLRSGYCPSIHEWAKAAGIARSTPERGDAFLRLLDYPEGRFASHSGLVTEVNGNRFRTIEGNTNAGLSNEGDGVYQRERPVTPDYAFIRWARLIPADAPAPTFALVINGKHVADMPVVSGRSLCPLRKWADHWNLAIAWDADTQTVCLNGKRVAAPLTLIDGASFAPVAELVRGTRLALGVDSAERRVVLTGAL